MIMPFVVGLNFKEKTPFIKSRTFHIDACTSMEHAYPSHTHTHIVLKTPLVTHTLGHVQTIIFLLKSYTNAQSFPYWQRQNHIQPTTSFMNEGSYLVYHIEISKTIMLLLHFWHYWKTLNQ